MLLTFGKVRQAAVAVVADRDLLEQRWRLPLAPAGSGFEVVCHAVACTSWGLALRPPGSRPAPVTPV